jgi:hypothetical protein
MNSIFFDPAKLKPLKSEEVRELLFRRPKLDWKGGGETIDGVEFEIESSILLKALYAAFGQRFHGIIDPDSQPLKSRRRGMAGGGFLRLDTLDATEGKPLFGTIEHAELGSAYLDFADRTHLHFSPDQLPAQGYAESAKALKLEWEVSKEKGLLVVSIRGMLRTDLLCSQFSDKVDGAWAKSIFQATLPGFETLQAFGLPLDSLLRHGVPGHLELWSVNKRGERAHRLATHQVSGLRGASIAADQFAVPKGFRDLRPGPDEKSKARKWYPLLAPPRSFDSTQKRAARNRVEARPSAQSSSGQNVMQQAVQFFPEQFKVATEPALPSCLPATIHTSTSLEIRQELLDVIFFVVNRIVERLTTFMGSRVDPDDPDNRGVEITIDWLSQFEQFSDGQQDATGNVLGDALFCLLRDPSGGGEGLLDRLATTLARQLMAVEDPLPLGGEDDPIALPAPVEANILQIVADATIVPEERFDNLSADDQSQVRENVLQARFAALEFEFNGDLGDLRWPSEDFDLVRVQLQLENVEVELNDPTAVGALPPGFTRLRIEVDDDGRPSIAFRFRLSRFEANVQMIRSPGNFFWYTAAGILVAGLVVGPAAITALLLTLIGLGPFGLLLLAGLVSLVPTAIAGSAVLLAAVTYLVWDVSRLHVELGNAEIRSRLAPRSADDPEELVLDPDNVQLLGNVTVTVNSEIPSGIHQIFDAIANLLLDAFEDNVRDVLEDVLTDMLESAIRRLPHFRLPQPFSRSVVVPVTGSLDANFGFNVPRHELLGTRSNGVQRELLSAGAVTTMGFVYERLAPYLTQVDQDLRPRLSQRISRYIADGGHPFLGYGISQNLLNGIVFAHWLSGRFLVIYDEARVDETFQALTEVRPEFGDILTDRQVHVRAASSPHVLLTPRGFEEDPRHPYLFGFFPDIRVCIAGYAKKPVAIELQFSAQCIAHVAFGSRSNGNRTLFTLERTFIDVLMDPTQDTFSLSPVETQGIEILFPPGADIFLGLSTAERLQFFQDIRPILTNATARLLRRLNAQEIILEQADVLNRHVYDGVARVTLIPSHVSLYAIFETAGIITNFLPHRNANNNLVDPTDFFDINEQTCQQGIDFRNRLPDPP